MLERDRASGNILPVTPIIRVYWSGQVMGFDQKGRNRLIMCIIKRAYHIRRIRQLLIAVNTTYNMDQVDDKINICWFTKLKNTM